MRGQETEKSVIRCEYQWLTVTEEFRKHTMNCYLTFYFPCLLTEFERRVCPQSPEQSKQDQELLTFPPTTHPPWGPRTLLPPFPPAARGWKLPTHLHKPPGLTDDSILEAIQGKAINLLHDSDWGLSNLLHQGVGSVHCRGGRLRVWDQLDQWHIIWWIYLTERQKGRESKDSPGAGVLFWQTLFA